MTDLAYLVSDCVAAPFFKSPSLYESPDGVIQVASRTGGFEGVIGKCNFVVPSALLIISSVVFFRF